jgi:hypothetical protein
MVHVCDLAQNRVEAGKRGRACHMRACVRTAKHRFKGVATAPLRVVDDVSAVKTRVNVGGNEPGFGLIVAAGSEPLRLLSEYIEKPFTMDVLHVVISKASEPKLFAMRDRTAPVQFQ